MESYNNFDLHLQFVCLFPNERLYIDSSRLKLYSTNFQPNGQSLLLNPITGVNCIQSAFSQCKLQQSKVTNKKITGTKQYRN